MPKLASFDSHLIGGFTTPKRKRKRTFTRLRIICTVILGKEVSQRYILGVFI